MDDARSPGVLPPGVSQQLRGRLPAQTGEPGRQRLPGGLGQVSRGRPALRQPHHQAEVSRADRTTVLII